RGRDRRSPGRGRPPSLGPARLSVVQHHVQHRLPAPGGALRPVWGHALPARGRQRGHRAPPVGRLPPGDRPGAGPLQEEGPPATGRGHGQPGRRLRPHHGRAAMILLKSRQEIEQMRAASTIVATILEEVASRVRPGVTTAELDALAEELTLAKGARPAFKGYTVAGRVYPASICISINDEVVHGVPNGKRALRAGDIVGLDFGVCYRGYFGDAARTVPVGRVAPEAERLMEVTAAALHAGIDAVRPGAHVADISAAIQDAAESAGFSVVREFVGH